jgi:nitrite reductase/ring-hydroxylating ferredoxin subunit
MRVAVYERTVAASLDRTWENVLDWEHLPWLHRESFSSIDCRDAGDWGWRARVGLRPGGGGGEILLELVTERDALRYVARTLEGSGAGTEIWTRLSPRGEGETGVAVSFHVPALPAAGAEALGAAFTKLYARLWDQDEAMMVRRSQRLAARQAKGGGAAAVAPLALGRLASLRSRLPLVVELGGRPWRVVECGRELLAHAADCPHRLGPLDDVPLEAGCVRCPWHGYRFDVRTGASPDGRRLRLPPPPRVVVDAATSEVRLVPQG